MNSNSTHEYVRMRLLKHPRSKYVLKQGAHVLIILKQTCKFQNLIKQKEIIIG